MTPKEKAKELVERYNCVNKAPGSFITTFQVKQCALIAIKEIMGCISWHLYPLDREWNYWQEVKQEIEKL